MEDEEEEEKEEDALELDIAFKGLQQSASAVPTDRVVLQLQFLPAPVRKKSRECDGAMGTKPRCGEKNEGP